MRYLYHNFTNKRVIGKVDTVAERLSRKVSDLRCSFCAAWRVELNQNDEVRGTCSDNLKATEGSDIFRKS